MPRIAAALVVAAALVLAARAFYHHHAPKNAHKNAPPRLATPAHSNYYLKKAVVYQMDAAGRLAYRISGARALHFRNGAVSITDIDVHYVKGTKTYWELAAARARVPPGEHAIYLYGGVHGRHPRRDGRAIRFSTDHAWVRPDRDRIDSDAPVTAFAPGGTVEGDKMRIDLDTDAFGLRDDVHVTYRF